MKVFENVISPDSALRSALEYLEQHGETADSRNGLVIRAPKTVVTEWRSGKIPGPSLNPTRDANPFLHYLEFAWLLTGTNRLEFMRWLTASFADYSDDGATLPATYGWRWRTGFGVDQLAGVVEHLRAAPATRRAVLQMYHPTMDVRNLATGKDVPCNLTITLTPRTSQLDMSVFCRSNDVVFGAYGANVVQFSLLHALICQLTDKPLGTLTQISCDFHAYKGLLEAKGLSSHSFRSSLHAPTAKETFYAVRHLGGLREQLKNLLFVDPAEWPLAERPFSIFLETVTVMLIVYRSYKRQQLIAGGALEYIRNAALSVDESWVYACVQWLKRRAGISPQIAEQVELCFSDLPNYKAILEAAGR